MADYFDDFNAKCISDANQEARDCLRASITKATNMLLSSPNLQPSLHLYLGDCLPQLTDSEAECVRAVLTRTVKTLQLEDGMPRNLKEAREAPLGPEGIYLDEEGGVLYVADFIGFTS